MPQKKLKVGLLGCGTVGRGLVELVTKNDSLIRQRTGVELGITKILVRDLAKPRPGIDRALLTTDADKVLNNGCDLVVELVGGIEPARSFIQQSLSRGKHVVTANKALLALEGFSLMKAAKARKVRLGFEGSVCGGIPIIRALRNGLVGNQIQSISGILNGTCNYILTRMTEGGMEFGEALGEAQVRGFAEADPSLDVDGHDAAQKLKILAELAFGSELASDAVQVEGIREITADDVEAARELGYVIKHVATAQVIGRGLSLRAGPILIPRGHVLAGIREENNAVVVRGDAVGDMLFSGKGAGSLPSASAVLSDVLDIACHNGGFSTSETQIARETGAIPDSKYYLRFTVNEPSVIGPITAVLERDGIEVARAAAVWSRNGAAQHQVRLVSGKASQQGLQRSLQAIAEQGHTRQSLSLPIMA